VEEKGGKVQKLGFEAKEKESSKVVPEASKISNPFGIGFFVPA
jgi:hypothetical protein